MSQPYSSPCKPVSKKTHKEEYFDLSDDMIMRPPVSF